MHRKIIILSVIAIVAFSLIGALIYTTIGRNNLENQMELGNKYLEEGNYEKAILAYQAVIEIDENSVEARIGIAVAYMGLENYKEAEMMIKEAIDIDKTVAKSWEILIQIYEITNKSKIEIKELVEAAYKKTEKKRFLRWLEEHTPENAKVNIESGTYEEELLITIDDLNENDIVYYTTDGSIPTLSSDQYKEEIFIGGDTILILKIENEWGLSSIVEYEYKFKLPKISKMTKYVNARFGFSVSYPESWGAFEESHNGDGVFIYNEAGNDIRAYAGHVLEELDTELDNANEKGYSISDVTTDSGLTGYLIIGEEAGNIIYHYVIYADQKHYDVYAKVTKFFYSKNEDILLKMIQSMNILNKYHSNFNSKEELLDFIYNSYWVYENDPIWFLQINQEQIICGDSGNWTVSTYEIEEVNLNKNYLILHIEEEEEYTDDDSGVIKNTDDYYVKLVLKENKLQYEYKYNLEDKKVISNWLFKTH